MKITDIPSAVRENLWRGTVIPALPLALDRDRQFSPVHQTALIRYYLDAGSGGIAVGVHSTQFEIRDPEIDLFEPVLKVAAATIDQYGSAAVPPMKIAGVCGPTRQAVREAELACRFGYHACLLSLAALSEAEPAELVTHCRAVAGVMPVIGFYLQPAVGGRVLPYAFWRAFVELENVLAIKVAPFNRYQTLDVTRAVADSGKEQEVVLYTGNDDSIMADLLTPFCFTGADGTEKTVRFRGGLLGHWAVWTRTAVRLLEQVRELVDSDLPIPPSMLKLGMQITDSNAAFFDAANGFAGCIPGIHEVLRRQGLLEGTWCLNPREQLSPGQAAEIDRVYRSYPHLNDDHFVRENLSSWMRGPDRT